MLNTRMNLILFESGQKFAIDEPSAPLAPDAVEPAMRMAATINRNLQDYGYCLDAKSLAALSAHPAEKQRLIAKDLFSVLHEHLGDQLFQNTQTFYPGFPEEVMGKDDFELYANAVFYYLGENVFGINAHKMLEEAGAVSRKPEINTPLLEMFAREMKYITLTDESELHRIMDSRIHGAGMSKDKLEGLLEYGKEFPREFANTLSSGKHFQSKENMVNIACALHRAGNDRLLDGTLSGRPFFRDATDILRLAAVLSNDKLEEKNNKNWRNSYQINDANLSGSAKKMVFRLSSGDKKLVMRLLDRCPDLHSDLWKNKDKWKKAMPYIGMKYASGKVKSAFDNLAKNKKLDRYGNRLKSMGRRLELAVKMLKEKDCKPLGEIAKAAPGLFAANFAWILDSAPDKETAGTVCGMLKENCGTVNPMDLLRAKNLIDKREEWEWRVFPVKSGKLKVVKNDPKPSLDKGIKEAAIAAFDRAAKESASRAGSLGKVYVDPELSHNKIPTRGERNSSGGATLTFGSDIPCREGKNLVAAGIWWKNMKSNSGDEIRADIDVSVTFYNADGGRMDEVYYCHLRNDYCIHSGDFTSGDALRDGKGVEEIVVIDKEKARQHGARYAVMEVHGFSCDFNKAENVRAVFMEKEGSLDEETLTGGIDENSHPVFCGQQVEGIEIEQSVRLNAPASHEIPVFLDLEQDRYFWIDSTQPIGNGIRNVSNPESRMQGIANIIRAENNAIPDMKQLFEAHAVARGELVETPEEADTVFLSKPADRAALGIKEDARIITAYDLDTISAEFCTIESIDDRNAGERAPEHTQEKEPDDQMDKDRGAEFASFEDFIEGYNVMREKRIDESMSQRKTGPQQKKAARQPGQER